jgi:hypothetical protein
MSLDATANVKQRAEDKQRRDNGREPNASRTIFFLTTSARKKP